MSFILDALKKSENDRQSRETTDFAAVPVDVGRRNSPLWLWLVGGLLAVNLAVLVFLYLKPETQPSAETPAAASHRADDSLAQRLDAARQRTPRRQPPPSAPKAAASTQPAAAVDIVSNDPSGVDTSAVFPSLLEVSASGAVSLPELHLDIHVFSESPDGRFVFVNMSKYREGDVLDEGPNVVEITPGGVVLQHRGVTFLLPRE